MLENIRRTKEGENFFFWHIAVNLQSNKKTARENYVQKRPISSKQTKSNRAMTLYLCSKEAQYISKRRETRADLDIKCVVGELIIMS